ncbi:hypothetical protein HY972_03390 [Candidatus Kaiserbacteria bacterium]|nr:hypothetical protein [Candidatus Kaiserbacteria bacterium]
MTNEPSNIERIVMQRVHLIRMLKLVISTAIFAALSFVAALWGIGREVWVARVLENAPVGPEHILAFYLAAFMHTRLIVQALVILTLLSFLFLARETVRFFLVSRA